MKKIVKLGIFMLLLSLFTSCSELKEMLKRDLEIERQRAAADKRAANHQYY